VSRCTWDNSIRAQRTKSKTTSNPWGYVIVTLWLVMSLWLIMTLRLVMVSLVRMLLITSSVMSLLTSHGWHCHDENNNNS
jgi:hypothetical protein